jgi:hypothetical protein
MRAFGIACLWVLGLGCEAAVEPEGPLRYEENQVAQVEFICPGDPSGVCDLSDETTLLAGAAAIVATPTEWETWTDNDGNGNYSAAIDEYIDCGIDRLCEGDAGYPGPDEGELDGTFQPLWMAGFDNSRAVQSVADELWARATVLKQGNTEIAVVSCDLVGLFLNEVELMRERAREELGIDHILLSSTHVHEAPDTMGQWGRVLAESGVNPAHLQLLHDSVFEAIRQAQENLVAVDVRAGRFDIPDDAWGGRGINNVNIDTRDPAITDERILTTRFVEQSSGATVATWVNFANHPETSGSRNLAITSDFAHTVRTTVEDGAAVGPDGGRDGVGGVAIYIQGAVGGMMTTLRADTIDLDGTEYTEDSIEKAYATGRVYGYHALEAIDAEVAVAEPTLKLRTKTLFLPVENTGFHILLNAEVFDRPGFNYNEDEIITQWNQPDLKTELDLLQIGSVAALSIPGELLPELAIGGYDGSHTGPLQDIVDPNNGNPPDLSAAPEGPYLKDLMPGDYNMIIGLGNDEIGYLVPEYNYKLAHSGPYLNEAPGDHYEETNSVGESAVPRLLGIAANMIAFEPPEL